VKQTLDPTLEKARLRSGPYASDESYGTTGAFQIRDNNGTSYYILSSTGEGWEHVSVSLVTKKRCPSWEEMCFVKDLFWEKGETVVQYHPAEEDYVNCHPYTLHLWKPLKAELPKPDPLLIGTRKKKVKRH
jgi:hypothetical protein